MPARGKSLYELFSDYDEERLLRIVTVERHMYRPEALTAAEKVLLRRGVALPLAPWPAQTPPPAAGGSARPASPYGPVDFMVDALLFGFLYWVTWAMDVGSMMPESWLADGAVRLLFVSLLTFGVMYLRQVWRTKEW